MISVEDARAHILEAFSVLPAEEIALAEAAGRVLAEDLVARRTQPPAAVSAMDGYAVRAADITAAPVTLRQIGAVPAGASHDGALGQGECVRIFTGAPLPEGADAIVIQEDVEAQGDDIRIAQAVPAGTYVRPAGLDFKAGETGLAAGRRLTARDIGLAAAMNRPWLRVRQKPRIAILASGDEVVMPGDPIGPNQIVSSNSHALAAFVRARGGQPVMLGIARDTIQSIRETAAAARDADLLLTTGGASVGDHDLIQEALGEDGLDLDFWRIAMRPGKPLMFGRMASTALLGFPGNPVSSMVCALIFLGPAIDRMLGAPPADLTDTARLGTDLRANDRRQDYLRAGLHRAEDGALVATPFPRQDSSMMATVARAECLILRPPLAPAAAAGDPVSILHLSDRSSGL
ncbi:MAG: molybdopterin molybdotransferase MoeA [Rhodospirillaceae bacterium]|jgi:molybdopterin molybdotransferase|nr:molybdopterin molybdotransferase MoeA [Rhodospirillaceae bacterium]